MERNTHSVKNRFQRHISKGIQCHNRHHKEIKQKNPSGHTEKDIIKLAEELCLQMEGKQFTLGECVFVSAASTTKILTLQQI